MIFPAEHGFLCHCPTARYWTPTREDVLAAEGRVRDYLEAVETGIADRLGRYRRQYVGVVDGGPSALYELLRRPREIDWGSRAVVVEDGGDAFFQIFYDIEAGTFEGLSVNGVA